LQRGWDNTGANGANLSFPQEFGIADRHWLVAVINAAPALFGLLSAWAADPVNQLLGRRGTIFATNLFVVFPVLVQGFSKTWVDLMICRLFMGIGMGIKISTIPVCSVKVSPASIRGAIVTSFQLYVAFGILVGSLPACSGLRASRTAHGSDLALPRESTLAHEERKVSTSVPSIQSHQKYGAYLGKRIVLRPLSDCG
jgi:MFS family permease